MTNREKYKKELDEILIDALMVVDGKPEKCGTCSPKCDFYHIDEYCLNDVREWLDAEAEEGGPENGRC